jgi:hypothetical protein
MTGGGTDAVSFLESPQETDAMATHSIKKADRIIFILICFELMR